jgi:CRISPR-associated protein Csm3
MSETATTHPATLDTTKIYTFRGELQLRGALHIGSGDGDDRTDATVVRDSRGNPYVPGSSLRGALRAAVQRHSKTLLDLDPIRDEDKLRAVEKDLGALSEERKVELLTASDKKLNDVERLFGTTMWASPLTIADLPLIDAQREIGEIRHGVGIDRDTGAAAEGLKYDFEVLPRGYRFQLHMRCEIDGAHDGAWTRLLALGLRLLEVGELPLGGRAARGVGLVQLTGLTVYRLDMQKQALLAALLSEPDSAARYGTKLDDGWTMRILKQV